MRGKHNFKRIVRIMCVINCEMKSHFISLNDVCMLRQWLQFALDFSHKTKIPICLFTSSPEKFISTLAYENDLPKSKTMETNAELRKSDA